MNNSTAILLIVAVLTVAAVMGMMMYYLDALNQLPEGKPIKVGLAVAGKHDLTNFKLSAQDRPGGRVLLITYETDRILPNRERVLAEMREVASDTWNEMAPEDKARLATAEVHRQFNRSTGCFNNSSREKLAWTPPPESRPRLDGQGRPPIVIPKQK